MALFDRFRSSEGWYDLGRERHLAKDFAKAIELYSKAIEKDPSNAYAYDARGNVFIATREPERALADYEKATSLMPGHAGMLGNLGLALSETGQHDRAIAVLKQALGLDPAHEGNRNLLALAFLLGGRWSEAIAAYSERIARDPGDGGAYDGRAHAYAGAGELEKALADRERCVAAMPNEAMVLANLGALLVRLDRCERAAGVLHAAIEINPGDIDSQRNLAFARFKTGDHAGAVASYTDALALAAGDTATLAQLYADRGACHRWRGANDDAIADYTRAVELDPGVTAAFVGRGNALNALAKPEAALADFDRALALEPDRLDALRGRSEAARQLERWDRCLADLSRILELRPDDRDAIFGRGYALLESGEPERAIPDFETCVTREPALYEAVLNLAIAHERAGDTEAMRTHYARVLELRPGPETGTDLGNSAWAKLMLGRAPDALADAERAATLEPAKAFVHGTLGHVLAALGRHDEAIASLRRLLELGASAYHEAEARKALARLDAVRRGAEPAGKS